MTKLRDLTEVGVVTPAITEFRGRWSRLSNYAACTIWFDGHIYPSVEHAYQAAKTLDESKRRTIRHLPSPNQSKQAGRKLVLREDWDRIKVNIMIDLLREKFAQEPDRTILVSTGDRTLIEGNWWGDTFWGCPLGEGDNWLGKLLTAIRKDLNGGRL